MTTIERHIDVHVPVADAYSQWTQFEDMPRFLEHVERVHQIDDRHLRWEIEVDGTTKAWTSEITEQIPDKRIAWTSIGGMRNAGCVTFHRLGDDLCRIMLQLEVEVPGNGRAADAERRLDEEVARELEHFKDFLERRQEPTGRWEGVIPSLDDCRRSK